MACALGAACGQPEPVDAPAPATAASEAGPAPAAAAPERGGPPPACDEGARACLGPRAPAVCRGGALVAEAAACGAAAVCAEGACVDLKAGPEALPAARVLRLDQGEGWWNAWGGSDVLDWDKLADVGPDVVARLKDWTPVCVADAHVTGVGPRRSGRRVALGGRVLAGYLVVGADREARLKTSVRGHLRVWVAGREVVRTTRDTWAAPLVDEQEARVDLKRGVWPVVAVVGQTQRGVQAGFTARLVGADGAPVPDARWIPHQAACAADALLRHSVDQRLDGEGFRFKVRARWPGASPDTADADVALVARLRSADGAEASPLAQGPLLEPLTVRTGPLAAGAYTLHVETSAGVKLPSREVVAHGALHRRAAALKASLKADLDAARPVLPQGSIDSYTHHVRELAGLLEANDADAKWIARRVELGESMAAELRAGRDPYARRTGLVRRAYRSRLDGKLQPYAVLIPSSYDPSAPERLSLTVAFHGLDSKPEHALRVAMGKAPPGSTEANARHMPPLGEPPGLVVAPWGYKNAGQRLLGEHDVMRVIEEMQAHYRVDPLKISMTGYSLGGTVSFVVPLHHPGVFAAASPLCGYPNFKSFQQIRGAAAVRPWEEALIEERAIENYAANGLHMPMHIVHGGKDQPERSEVMARALRRMGYWTRFDVQEDMGHNVWDYAYEKQKMLRWLRWHTRPAAPDRARLTTGAYRYNRAYWLELLQMTDPLRFASIDAAREEGAARLTVTTENVSSFVIDLKALGLSGGAVEARIDGQTVQTSGARDALVLAREGSAWAALEERPSLEGRKRPGVSGPLTDALLHRQLIVYGTQDPAQTDANRRVARFMASADPHWAVRYPVKADVDVTDEEAKAHTLVLIGNAASNALTRRFEEALPVRFDAGGLSLGARRFEGEDVGVSLIHPHPLNSGEYLVLHAGVGAVGTLASRHLPRLVPDVLVYDQGITTQRRGALLDGRRVRYGGFFGPDWSLERGALSEDVALDAKR